MSRRTVKNESHDNRGNGNHIEHHYRIPVKGENFYMTFFDHLDPVLELTNITDMKLLMCIMMELCWNSNVVKLGPQDKKALAERIGVTPGTIANSLMRLKKKKIIRGSGSNYEVSEKIFWRGGTDKRKDLLSKRNSK